ncbi:monovalent cation/H(+) antiporter subunit G [Wolbachia endosymbiont of Ctenocephalides felis wCfeT]|uniref:monovalent cation/H(+) antiporter subunit G n=1 Tax=Wolbachia endosymbiont of Ctenocephalides felis wCfeT TaxID=2732593 RepID=UPI001447C288|nr:monovalent cation/H(+) antiporter subunit G [Wolbachia endosymbiont of Ctenocephalides felis wCfeT]
MISVIFIFLSLCLIVISNIGVMRFPDFYTRLHAAGITDSSGATLLLIGLILQNKLSTDIIKIILLISIIWIANSTNSYILARTYYKSQAKIIKKD